MSEKHTDDKQQAINIASRIAGCAGGKSHMYAARLSRAWVVAESALLVREDGQTLDCDVMPDLLAALELVEARLTAVGRAFYVTGTKKSLQEALKGWVNDAELARAAVARAKGENQ